MEDALWESSGLTSNSKLLKYKFNGNVLIKDQSKNIRQQYFGEGADFVVNKGEHFIYQLTWQDRVMFVY